MQLRGNAVARWPRCAEPKADAGLGTTTDGRKGTGRQGLDTATPFLSIAGQTYRGSHERVVGTNVLFRKVLRTQPWRQAAVPGRSRTLTCVRTLIPARDGPATDDRGDASHGGRDAKRARADDGAQPEPSVPRPPDVKPTATWRLDTATERIVRMHPVKLTPKLGVALNPSDAR